MKPSIYSLRFMTLALIISVLLLGWAVAYRPAAAQSTTYDAVADFNDTTNNTEQVWQYGYTETNGTGFKNYVDTLNILSNQNRGWHKPDSDGMSVIRNYSGQNLDFNECTTHQPDVLAMFPSNDGRKTVVRWKAPQSGQYSIKGRFQNIDHSTADGSIVLNRGNIAQPIFGPVSIDSPNSCHQTTVTRSFSLTVTVNAGDTIDFRVGWGSNNNYSYDGVGLAATITSVPEGSCISQPTGAVAWYRAEGDADDSKGGNNGTLQGGATFDTGKVGQAFKFTGTGSYVQVGPASSLVMTSAATFDAWIYPTGAGSDTTGAGGLILNKEGEYGIARFADGSIQWAFANTNPGWNWHNTNFIAPLNQWTHIAVVYNGGDVTTYANGVAVDSFDGSGNIGDVDNTLNDFRIGNRSQFEQGFHGLIDEVDVLSRALSQAEIQAIYNAGSAGKCAPQCVQNPSGAVAWYQGEGDADDSQGTNNGALQNGTTFAAGKVGQALSFDGVDDFVQVADSLSLNPTSAITLEGWVYVTGGQGLDRDIISKDGEASERQYLLSAASTNKYRVHVGVPSGFISFDGSTPVQLNTWTHIAMTYDGAALKLYVNGELDGSQAVTGSIITTTQPLRIGGGAPVGQPQTSYPGKVDEAGIFDRALSQSEIQTIYNAGGAGKCSTTPTPTPTSHNAAGDFSIAQNPNGVWSYGMTANASPTSTFSLFTSSTTSWAGNSSADAWFVGGDPSSCAGNVPVVVKNKTTGTITYCGVPHPPDTLDLHPGVSGGERAVVRFTAPATDTYSFVGNFRGVDQSSKGTTTDAVILLNNGATPLFSANVRKNVDSPFDLQLSLNQGDVVDFSVGPDTDGGASDSTAFTVTITAPDCTPQPSGAVTWYRAEGNADDSQGTNDGTLQNGAAFAAGKVGQAFSLDGSNDYVSAPDSPSLRPASVTGEAWFKFSSTPGAIHSIFSKPVGTGTHDSYTIWVQNGTLRGGVADGGTFAVLDSGISPAAGVWYHAALTFDDATNTAKLYVNGTERASANLTGSLAYDSHPLLIGGESDNETIQFFVPGLIDEVSIFDRAFSASEVSAIYDAGSAGRCGPAAPTCDAPTGAVAWYQGENDGSDAAGDHNGTPEGGATFAAGKVGQAFSLDGTNDFVSVPDDDALDISNDITIEGWVEPSDLSGERVILSKRSPDGNDITYTLRMNLGQLEFTTRTAGGSVTGVSPAGTLAANQMAHVAFTLQGINFSFYVNGQLTGQSSHAGLVNRPATSGRLTIGAKEETAGAAGFFAGKLDEITLYDRALSATEVQLIFNQGAGGKCADQLPTISVADVTKTEGDSGTSDAAFEVTLSKASTQTVTVNYQTQAGSAAAGSDFQAASGTLEFTPGQTSKTVNVAVVGDTADEADETFTLELSNATAAVIDDAQGDAVVTDDDAAPGLQIGNATVTEPNTGAVNATFTVSLAAPTWQTVTVNYATADGTAQAVATTGQPADYTPATGTLTFDPGQTSKTVTVAVKGDAVDEANETFKVLLSNASNAPINADTGTGTITDNDATPSLRVSSPAVTEGNAAVQATFTITLSAASGQTVTVKYATANGTAAAPADYTAKALTTLTYAPGETTKTVQVDVAGDLLDEANETFKLVLSAPTNATLAVGTGTCTVTDNDAAPSLSVSNPTVTEGNSAVAANFTVTLSAASGQTVTVKYATANGTATAPADYTAKALTTLSFAAGQTTKTVPVSVAGDLMDEPAENFKLVLSSPTNATIAAGTGTCTVNDNDPPPGVRVSSLTVTEGNSATTANFIVSLSAPSSQTVTVKYQTANGTALAPGDYTAKALTTLTFAPGQTSQTVPVTIAGDLLDEATENFKLVLSAPTNATIAVGTGTCTITDNDPPPSITITNATVTEPDSGAVGAVFTVNLSAPSGQTVTVKYATANGATNPATAGTDYTALALTTLTFAPGQTSKNVSVPVRGDLLKEANETFFLNLSGAVNASISDSQGLGTITNDD